MSETTEPRLAATPFAGSILERRRIERAVTEKLLVEGSAAASAGTVLRVVLACAAQLRQCGLVDGFEAALYAMARARLGERSHPQQITAAGA